MNRVSKLIQTDKQLHKMYTLKEKRGQGCFGHVYDCVENKTYRQTTLKIQPVSADENQLTLEREYVLLKRLQHIEGIPKVFAFYQTLQLNFIELERLSMNLQMYLQKSKNISPDAICDMGCSIIQILREVHRAGIVHRDIKPQNIMLDDRQKIYLIDFGISSKVIRGQAKKRKSPRNGQFIGTPRYASLAAHEGQEIQPKDDIQSLLYVLIFATTQQLPWVTGKQSKFKVQEIGLAKKRLPKKEICKGMPQCYLTTFEYLTNLGPGQLLDHDAIIQFFRNQRQCEEVTHTTQTLFGQNRQTMKSEKRTSVEGFLSIPVSEVREENCIQSNRVLVEFITRIYLDEENDEMSIEEEIKSGELSLANRLEELQLNLPRLKSVVDGTFKSVHHSRISQKI